jgi:SOS response regulatory protein OraA/RecX
MSDTTIDAVLADAADPGMVRVRIGRVRVGPLRREDAERLGIEVGVRWTQALARKVRRITDAAACRADALRRLGRRDHSRALLEARLSPRWSETIAAQVVRDLVSEGWLDDRTYAERRAESLRRSGPMARDLLRERLESEGVNAGDAARASGGPDAAADLVPLAKRWKREGRSPTSIARALGRRGFDSDTIAQALQRAGLPCPLED